MRVRCSLEHAFATFTARLDLWWPRGHRRFEDGRLALEPRVGGRFFDRSPDGAEAVLGQVVLWEPPRALVYTWKPGSITEPTTVEVRFVAEGDHTRVDVLHREGDAALGAQWLERVALFTRGWGAVLPAFAAAAEGEA